MEYTNTEDDMSRVIVWTEEKKQELRELWDLEFSASQIAKQLGETCTKNAVIGMAHRMGLASRPHIIRQKPEVCVEVTPEKRSKPRPYKPRPIEPFLKRTGPIVKNAAGLVSLLDLRFRDCHFPIGDPKDEGFGFCGAQTRIDKVYCEEHLRLCYVGAPARKVG